MPEEQNQTPPPIPPENELSENFPRTEIPGEEEKQTPETPQIKKKDPRGRHLKKCRCQKCRDRRKKKKEPEPPEENTAPEESQAPPPQEKTGEEKLNDFFDQFKKDETIEAPPEPPTEQKPTATVIISGATLLLVADAVLPGGLLKILRIISPSMIKGVKAQDIKMSPEQREALEPVADAAAKEIFDNMPPIKALVVSLAFVYGGNIVAASER